MTGTSAGAKKSRNIAALKAFDSGRRAKLNGRPVTWCNYNRFGDSISRSLWKEWMRGYESVESVEQPSS